MSTTKTFIHRKTIIVAMLLAALASLILSLSQQQQQAFAAGTLPCDLYASGGTPCVAAHSTTRALYSAYSGKLYQVQRFSDKATTDIGTLTAGGYANAAAQDTFCSGTTCIITKIYDQSSQHNDLTIEGPGGVGKQDRGADASALKVKAGGHSVYGIWVDPATGYRDNSTTGIPTGSSPQGVYMVASGTHVNNNCCFDYGGTEVTNYDTGNGHMDAVYLGKLCWFTPCSGSGPWVMADLENGLFAGGNGSNSNNTSMTSEFVTAMMKNSGTSTYAIKGGNATSGSLKTMYSGALPTTSGYNPMHAEGGIVLGTGGDNSNTDVGSFYEGAMTAGYPSDATENAVQANIVSVGYSLVSTPSFNTIVGRGSNKCLDVQQPNLEDGANVGIYTCNGGLWQNWKLVDMGNGYYNIRSQNSGMCLDVQQPNTSSGANVGQYTCNGQPWQEWNKVTTTAPYFKLISRNSGLALDVSGASTADGANVEQYTDNGGTNQQWQLK